MKKTLICIFAVLLVCCSAFAETVNPVEYADIDFSFQPTTARYDSMGQSGLALPTKLDSFFTNPANLAVKRGFAISVPSFSTTIYNLQKIVADEEAMTIIDAMSNGDASDEDTVKLATKYLNNLGLGRNAIAKFDFGFGLQLGIIGLGENVQVKLHTLNPEGSLLELKIIPEVNVAETLALGLKIIDTNYLTVSVGGSVHYVYKAYFKGIGGNTALKLVNDTDKIEETLLWDTPVMGGYAIPFDLGATIGFFDNQFTVSATANNLNGTYHMKSYQGAGYLLNEMDEGTVADQPEGEPKESVEFPVETPWTLNFGVAFAPDIIFHPVITADLVDMLTMVQSFGEDDFRAEDLLLHLNAGAEVTVLGIAKARIGVNRGFMSIGAGLWLPFAQVDASYGWQEFGAELGDKPVDSFTIKFSLGYDK